ncbi:NHL repeat-containing protein [Candidatus Latescibacterota bacterium]
MKRLMATAILGIGLSCAGNQTVLPPDTTSVTIEHPQVTGAVRLSFAGTLGDEQAIRSPWGISFGIDGTLYVCDRGKSSIVRLDSTGVIRSHFDSFTNRTERLYAPIDVCSSSGIEVYCVDATDSRVLRFDRNLKNGYTIHRGGTKEVRLFGAFNGLAYDRISGDLYITDRDAGTVIRVDMLGGSIRSLGGFGAERKSLIQPAGLDVDDEGGLYVADTGYGAIAVIRKFGSKVEFIGGNVLKAPVDAAVLPGGRIAVADLEGVVILSPEGIAAGSAGFGVDRVMVPRSVAYRNGRLYVSDGLSATILIYDIKD